MSDDEGEYTRVSRNPYVFSTSLRKVIHRRPQVLKTPALGRWRGRWISWQRFDARISLADFVFAESLDDVFLLARLAPPDRATLPPHGRCCGARVRRAQRPSRRDLAHLDRRLRARGRVLLLRVALADAADRRAAAVLCAAVAQHARRHGGPRIRQGQPARGDPQRP